MSNSKIKAAALIALLSVSMTSCGVGIPGILTDTTLETTQASVSNFPVEVASSDDKLTSPILTPEQKQFKLNELLKNGIKNTQTSIDISELQISESDIYAMTNDFNCSFQNYSFCFEKFTWVRTGDYINRIEIVYDDPDTVSSRLRYIESETTRIASMIDPTWSDLRKALWINDYIYDRIEYDHKLESREIDKALSEGMAVCEGISGMFIEIGNKAGLNVSYASSKSQNHVWNIVEIDGVWYNVDVVMNINSKDRYAAFLLSDAAYLPLANKPDDVLAKHECADTKYDKYFWTQSGISSIVFAGSTAYWANEGVLYTCDLSSNLANKMAKVNSDPWLLNGEPLVHAFVDLASSKTGFFYNSASSVYHYSVDTKKSTLVKKYDGASIFNIYNDGDELVIQRYQDFSTGDFEEDRVSISDFERK